MSTFRDFLIFYNNLDVKPFVEAIQKMKKKYSEKGVDVFKDDISVPGIARKLLFETSENNNTSFSLFDESNKDLYQTIKQNIVGGPSIVFHRYFDKEYDQMSQYCGIRCKCTLFILFRFRYAGR